jgi:hypothetical protein
VIKDQPPHLSHLRPLPRGSGCSGRSASTGTQICSRSTPRAHARAKKRACARGWCGPFDAGDHPYRARGAEAAAGPGPGCRASHGPCSPGTSCSTAPRILATEGRPSAGERNGSPVPQQNMAGTAIQCPVSPRVRLGDPSSRVRWWGGAVAGARQIGVNRGRPGGWAGIERERAFRELAAERRLLGRRHGRHHALFYRPDGGPGGGQHLAPGLRGIDPAQPLIAGIPVPPKQAGAEIASLPPRERLALPACCGLSGGSNSFLLFPRHGIPGQICFPSPARVAWRN